MSRFCQECGGVYGEGNHCPLDGAPLRPHDGDPLIGQAVGSWRITRLLGAGGMGRVYKAVQPQIGSRVAIKVLSQECAADANLVERFFAEARAVNLIRHENIVNVVDMARLPDGRPYIVMEYLDGEPLSQLIARGPLPLGGLAVLMVEVLGALEAAHGKGIIHRDLKPDNIWVTPSGRAKVLDFGIAKLASEHSPTSSATRTGALLGTPAYMSPEQAAARPVDPRSDLYALGVILFEGITGQRPFFADSLYEMLRQHVEVTPPFPRTLRPDCPPQLEAIVLRALAKAPAARYVSAADMAYELAALVPMLPPGALVVESASGNTASMPSPRMSPVPRPASLSTPSRSPFDEPLGGRTTPDPPRSRTGLILGLGAVGLMLAGGGVALVVGKVLARNDGAAATAASVGPAGAQHHLAGTPDAAPVAAGATPDAAAVVVPAASIDAAPEAVAGPSPGRPPSGRPPKTSSTPPTLTAGTKVATSAGTGSVATASSPPTGTSIGTTMIKVTDPIDRKRLDPIGAARQLRTWARRLLPDAELAQFYVPHVSRDGTADLLMGGGVAMSIIYTSPSRAKDPNVPEGATHQCQVGITIVGAMDVYAAVTGSTQCRQMRPVGTPRCTIKQIWERAIADGANPDAVATVLYNRGPNGRMWYFSVPDKSLFYPDDCGSAKALPADGDDTKD